MRNIKRSNTNQTRKGMTLVEVLVAIAVFSIISLALVTSYIGLINMVTLQDEYVRIEMVCHDINFHWDRYGSAWDDEYFRGNCDNDDGDGGKGFLKYDNDVMGPTTDASAPYTVEYNYVNSELIISIYTADREYVTDLNCGTTLYPGGTP